MYAFEVFVAGGLYVACLDDTLTDGSTRLTGLRLRDVLKRHGRNLALYVDAVEQRTGYLAHVTLYLSRCAAAFVRRVVVIAAGAGVHRGDEHERAGELHSVLRARDGYLMVFERLTQHFEGLLVEFGQLVGEQDTVMCQRYLARLRVYSAAYERHFGYGVMWRAERALRDERRAAFQLSGYAVYLRRLQTLRER